MTRETNCCFTGHRPEKLPWGTEESDPRCVQVKKKLEQALNTAYEKGFRHYICGMARGCDLYFAEAVLKLRAAHEDVTLECARPCLTQADRWLSADRQRYLDILDQCNYETVVQHVYDRGCMMRRNRYMVDHAAHVISIYDGEPRGGTAATLAYALRCGLTTDIIYL